MKAFKFTLQALLTLREQQEQKALQEYGRMLNAQERAVSDLESAREQLEEAREKFQNRLLAGCCANELWQLQTWCDSIERRVVEIGHIAQAARNNARIAFSRLLSARHATGIMHKLMEEQQRRHRREQRRHDQKVLDDLANRRNMMMMITQWKNPAHWN
jgi:flagellar export protein FliJ